MDSLKTLTQLIDQATSPYHTVKTAKDMLEKQKFHPLSMKEEWKLVRGESYVVEHYGSSLFAFSVGEKMEAKDGFRIGAAHGDFPGFSIKAQPELEKDGYIRLNVESYGGVNYMSWLDRPLSVAGKVVLKSSDLFHPQVQLVDFRRPILTIPNVAVHLNREMNQGVELKCQSQMLPLLTCGNEKHAFLSLLAKEMNVLPEDILDYELRVYCAEKGELVGAKNEFLSAPRLDNLTSVDALIYGITEGRRECGVNLMVVFDHEEIGSRSKQGAASSVLSSLMEKIYLSLGYTSLDYNNVLSDSLMLSVDVAHALHPAYTDKYDPVLRNVLNQGFGIKQACAQSYATDSEFVGIIQQICDENQIAYQRFMNHSDQKGGGTLGCIASALVPVRTVDVGVPLLAMHSSRELMGASDQESLRNFIGKYYCS